MSEFLSENFQFLVVKFSIYLNRHVFVMNWAVPSKKVPSKKSLQTCVDSDHHVPVQSIIWVFALHSYILL